MKLHDKPLVFIGAMGSGKSSLARRASAKYGGSVFDTDREFTRRYGDISEFFTNFGEAAFRKAEELLMIEAACTGAEFIATGGGAVLNRRGMNALRAKCDIVYLKAPTDILKARIARSARPLKNDLERTVRERKPLYERYADYTIDTSTDSLSALEAAVMYVRKNRYDAVLCDSDDTLLDFRTARSQSIRNTAAAIGLGCTPQEADAAYASVVCSLWHRLERGEIDKSQLDDERVKMLAAKLGTTIDAEKFNAVYIEEMEKTRFVRDGAINFLRELKKRGLQVYIITNSLSRIAEKRLEPLRPFTDGEFISDRIGYFKPDKRYFDYVLDAIDVPDKSRVIVFGDSETSDIAGAVASGLDCCLYDVGGKCNTAADFVARDYNDFLDIV